MSIASPAITVVNQISRILPLITVSLQDGKGNASSLEEIKLPDGWPIRFANTFVQERRPTAFWACLLLEERNLPGATLTEDEARKKMQNSFPARKKRQGRHHCHPLHSLLFFSLPEVCGFHLGPSAEVRQ
jgi:hypothetical protein